ncbi:response regulator [Shewanella sp. NIFS-20-20]|uniref:response regulator n=1 Tax=Shewanella sp. NIFS-20-20 TaxID=2853806 RepID=UPI001C480D48|nr:response regulator [Shewanella sp. NIFS-20-20]MBV7314820.1 response regulator [Shewanella sp. NIFS-20-20]
MSLKDVSVLLVEDDPVFRKLVADFLVKRGATVIEACDGAQGLFAFDKHSIDIVLADLSMPKMGGLDMLRAMLKIDPGLNSIVISGNNVMADVVDALRIGANDYLVKPVVDLFVIEEAIQQCIRPLSNTSELAELNQLSYLELSENMALLQKNTAAAVHVQQQLFPASEIEYPHAKVEYSLFNRGEISPYFIDSALVDNQHMIMYMAHFYPEDNPAAFASVLLRSFINQKLKEYRNNHNQTVIAPNQMLVYLNERLLNSGLDIVTDIVYISINVENYRAQVSQAGHGLRCYLRNQEGLTPLALADSMSLGLLDWGKPTAQYRTLLPHEKLCIGSTDPRHQQLLLADQFMGLQSDPDIPAGGFIQLSC